MPIDYGLDKLSSDELLGAPKAPAAPVAAPAPTSAPVTDYGLGKMSANDLLGVAPDSAAEAAKAAALFEASFGSPDEESKKRKLSADIERITGTYVAPGIMDFKEEERRHRIAEADHATRSSPRTSAFLSNAENAKIAIDDARILAGIEDSARHLARGALNIPGSLTAMGGAIMDVFPNPFGMRSELSSMARGWKGGVDTLVPAPKQAEGVLSEGWASGLESLGANLPVVVGSLLAFGPAGAAVALPLMAASSGGASAQRAQEKGAGPWTTLGLATTDAVAEYYTEKIGIKYLMDIPGLKNAFLKTAAKFAGAEMVGEQVATVWQDFNEWALLNPEKTIKDFGDERVHAAAVTAIATIVGGGGQVTVMKGLSHLLGPDTAKSDAETSGAALLAAMSQAAESLTLKRDPVAFNAFFQEVAGDSTVFVDREQLLQVFAEAKLDINEKLPSAAAQLNQATPEGIEIPIAELVTNLSGSGIEEQLVQHLRMEPNAMTIAEGNAKADEAKAFIEHTVEQIMGAKERSDQFLSEIEQIENDVVTALNSAWAYGTGANKTNAKIMGAWYATVADKWGVTPLQIRDGWTAPDGTKYAGWKPQILGAPTAVAQGPELSQGFDHGYAMLNIGLDVGAMARDQQVPLETVKAAIEKLGAKVVSGEVVESEYEYDGKMVKEMTFVPHLDRALTDDEVNQLAVELGQEAIGQYVGGEGKLLGPNAAAWGDFNPEFFKDQTGVSLAEAQKPLAQPQSARRPTTKKAPEDHLGEVPLTVDYTKMEPEKNEQNMKLVSQYPGIRFKARKADGRVEEFIQHVTNNLLWLHDQIPAEIRQRSKMWYDGARAITDRWTAKYGKSDAQIAAVLAIYSPQKDWFMNVSLAERTLDIVQNQQNTPWSSEMSAVADKILADEKFSMLRGAIEGKKLSELKDRLEQAAWLRTFDEAHNNRGHRLVTPEGGFIEFATSVKVAEKKTGWPGFGTIIKALYVIDDGSPKMIDNALGGEHKVRSFYNNIFHPTSDLGFVTIDTHAVAAGLLRPLSGNSLEVSHNFGSSGSAISAATGMSGTYAYYQEAYRRAAEARGLLPREMQSITWEAVRELYTMGFKHDTAKMAVVDKLWSEYEKGKRDLESVRAGILNLAGGVEQPSWVGRDPGISPEGWASTYTGELLGSSVPGRGTGNVDRGTGGGTAAGTAGSLYQAAEVRAGAVSGPVVGIHFSKAERPVLSSSAWGTGMKGAEGDYVRASADKRLRQRIAFYVNTGNGIVPESDVGSHAHLAVLENLYDADADVLKIWRNTPDERVRESAVLDAGFDGYLTRTFGKGGAVVMLGQRNLPVEYLGNYASTAWDLPKELKDKAVAAAQAVHKEMAGATSREDMRASGKVVQINSLQDLSETYPEAQAAAFTELLKGFGQPHDAKAVAGFMEGRTGKEALAAVLAEQSAQKAVQARAEIPPSPEIPAAKALAMELSRNPRLVSGQQSIEGWKKDLERIEPETAKLIDWSKFESGKMYYKADLAATLWQGRGAVDTDSAGFKKWSRDADIVARDDTFGMDFDSEKPVVVQVIHGTTGDFTTFDRERANPESDMGAGFYATNDELDASVNYAGEGADLTSKLEVRAEKIESFLEDDEAMEGKTRDEIRAEAKRRAREELAVQNQGFAMPVWMRFEKPFVLGGPGETQLTYETAYDEETDEYGEEAGTLVDFIVELRNVAEQYGDGSVEELVGALLEKAQDYGQISATDLFNAIRESEEFSYYTNDEDDLVSKEIFRQTLENIGYDGVIDQTVYEKFGSSRKRGQAMRGVVPGTKHFIVFNPEQIKSAISNTGDFSGANILFAGGPKQGSFSPATFELRLLADADLSTFLHEASHFFLAAYTDMAAQPGAPKALVDEVNAILGHLFKTVPGGAVAGGDLAQPSTDAFARWFGDSKVVDAEGKPLVVYHGTAKDFARFRSEAQGSNFDEFEGAFPRDGFWFTTDTGNADWYSSMSGREVGGAGRQTMPVYLSLQNPYRVSAEAFADEGEATVPSQYDLEQQGYDGIVVEIAEYPETTPEAEAFRESMAEKYGSWAKYDWSKYDADKYTALEAASYVPVVKYTHYVAFSPEQIKSAIGNRGTFDPMNPNILEQNGEVPAPGPLPEGPTPLGIWRQMSLDQQRPYHEAWAEQFEQYAMTGKAPSLELDSAFKTFANWLKKIYVSLKTFVATHTGGKLQPDTAAFFDRMLATEEQIATANAARSYTAMFKNAADAGMTDQKFADYMALSKEQTEDAEAMLRSRSLRDMAWLQRTRAKFIAAKQAEAAEMRKAIRDEIAKELAATPLRQAERFLKKGEHTEILPDGTRIERQMPGGNKLQISDVEAIFPEGALTPRPDLRKLGYGQYGMLANVGLAPDLVAEMFPGIRSGEALVRDLIEMKPFNEEVESLTDTRMLEEHSEMLDPDVIAKEADAAIHNDARTRMVATELAALNNKIGSPAALMKAAKAYATQIIETKTSKTLKPWAFAAAETRAGKAALALLRKGKRDEAAEQKRVELVNHTAAKLAYQAEAELKKTIDRFKKIAGYKDDSSAIKSRDAEIVSAIRAILADFGIGTKGKTAREYLAVVQQHNPDLGDVLSDVIDSVSANAKDWREMKISELRDLSEEIEGLWFLAKRSKQIEIDGKLITLHEAQQAIYDRLDAIGIPDRVPGEGYAPTPEEKRRILFDRFVGALRRVESWVGAKDGTLTGPFRQYMWNPIRDAADAYRADKVKYLKAYRDLLTPIAPTFTRRLIDAPEIGYVFGKDEGGMGKTELLHAILHTGNESNKRKLLLGRGWATERQDGSLDTTKWASFLQRMYDEGLLTKADYDFAQGVWDLLESMKPLAQKAHRDVYGKYFNEVTANEFTNQFGTYAGGYVPAMTDPLIVRDQDLNRLREGEEQNMAFAFPTTAKGFTKGRVEYNKPLKLDLRTLSQHIDKVLLFAHMTRPVNDVRRVMSGKAVAQALGRVDPQAYNTLIMPWLNRAAKQVVETPTPGREGLGRFWSVVRSRAGMAAMFANIANTVQQITGLSLAAVRVRPALLVDAMAKYVHGPKAMLEHVTSKSSYMQTRVENEVSAMSTQINDILLNPSVYESAKEWTIKHSYFLQSAMDNVIAPVVWLGGYNNAIETLPMPDTTGMTEEQVAAAMEARERDAIRAGDSAVRETQGSMAPEDIAAFEVGSAFYRMFVQFAGYFNMNANLLGTEFIKISRDMGLRKGAGRGLYVLTLGMAAPAIIGELIIQAFRGGPGDDDGDGEYLDDWLMAVFGYGPLRYATAMVPGFGTVINAAVNTLNNKPYDDRISTAPAISMIESAAKAPMSVYKAIAEDGKPGRAVKDVATLISMSVGLPASGLARPVSYAVDVATGNVQPTGQADAVRGIITGAASPASKQ